MADIKPTAFAQLLQEEFMWRMKPPITRPQELADALGISAQTAWNWLRGGKTPQPDTLFEVANKTGLSLARLYRACGYLFPENMIDKDELMNRLHQSGDRRYSAEEIQEIIEQLQAF